MTELVGRSAPLNRIRSDPAESAPTALAVGVFSGSG